MLSNIRIDTQESKNLHLLVSPYCKKIEPHTGSDMQESKVRQGICANVKEL
jgi:hypothetical protein